MYADRRSSIIFTCLVFAVSILLIVPGLSGLSSEEEAAAATTTSTYTGPQLSVSPLTVSVGGEVYIGFAVDQGTTSPQLPEASCLDPGFLYYNITEVSVQTPNNDEYQLGGATGSGFHNSTEGGPAPQIEVALGDNYAIPFGPESSGYQVTANSTSGTATKGEVIGTYYWWRNDIAGQGIPPPGQRVDMYPGSYTPPYSDSNPPAPTAETGQYLIDISGNTYCTESGPHGNFTATLFFDYPTNVTVTSSTTTSSTTSSTTLTTTISSSSSTTQSSSTMTTTVSSTSSMTTHSSSSSQSTSSSSSSSTSSSTSSASTTTMTCSCMSTSTTTTTASSSTSSNNNACQIDTASSTSAKSTQQGYSGGSFLSLVSYAYGNVALAVVGLVAAVIAVGGLLAFFKKVYN
jgi:hypothetical protein